MHTDSIQLRLQVDREDIAYLVAIFEAYDNLAVVRTTDRSQGHVELLCSPDFIDDVHQVLEGLKSEMEWRLLDE